MNNDKGNIGIITEERIIENLEEDIKNLYKVVNKLEQRISTLEKVLDSHAKCIGELRGTELRIHDLKDNKWTLDHGTWIM